MSGKSDFVDKGEKEKKIDFTLVQGIKKTILFILDLPEVPWWIKDPHMVGIEKISIRYMCNYTLA